MAETTTVAREATGWWAGDRVAVLGGPHLGRWGIVDGVRPDGQVVVRLVGRKRPVRVTDWHLARMRLQ